MKSESERHHEISSHLGWHQKRQHSSCSGGSPGQTDCRVQRPLHPHCELRPTRRCRQRMAVHQRTRTRTPMCELGWKSLGVLELTALPSIDEALWVPVVRETDVLLVNGGDPCICATGCGSPDWQTSCRRCARSMWD